MEGAAFIGLRRPRLTWPEASLCGVHIFSQSFHESEIVFLRVFSIMKKGASLPHIPARKESRMRKEMSKAKKRLLAAAIAVCVLLFALAAAAALYINSKMALISRPAAASASAGSSGAEDGMLSFSGLDLDDIDVMENGGTIEPPQGDVNVHGDITNILIIGSDEREEGQTARADSMMLVSVNSRENTWKLVSFERGVGVSIPNVGDDWLTHTYAYGGPELLLKTLQEYYKVDVSRYVKIDFSVFEAFVTDIGGVVVEMSQEEADYMNSIAGEEKWSAGEARLDGPTALVYARIRHLDSDWARVERQRQVMQAAADQVATLSLAKIDLIANHVLPMIETNLTNGELWQLALKMPALLGSQAQQMTVPDQAQSWTVAGTLEESLIACDIEAEAKRLDSFLLGEYEADAAG